MKTLVANAADEVQVKEATKKIKDRRFYELEDIRAILKEPHGRAFLWRVLEHCKVFESIYHPSALIHHNSGKQDVGHFIMAEIVAADDNAFLLMMKESKDKK